MPVQTALWRVGSSPERLRGAVLETERLLEAMILAAPQLLSDEWLLIGQQKDTGYPRKV
jgi:hypothetical protein